MDRGEVTPRRMAFLFAAFIVLVAAVGVARGQPVQERRFNSPEEAAAFIASLPPGSKIVESSVVTDQAASGQGAGLDAKGEKIVSDHNATAPKAALSGIGGAEGGDTETGTSVTGSGNGPNLFLLIAGAACFALAGWMVYRTNLRAAGIAGGVGVALFVTAFYPAVWLWVFGIGAVGLVGYMVYREVKAKQDADAKAKAEADAKANKEAARAMAGGIAALKTADPQAYEKVKAEVGKQADPQDVAVIAKIKEEDRL